MFCTKNSQKDLWKKFADLKKKKNLRFVRSISTYRPVLVPLIIQTFALVRGSINGEMTVQKALNTQGGLVGERERERVSAKKREGESVCVCVCVPKGQRQRERERVNEIIVCCKVILGS